MINRKPTRGRIREIKRIWWRKSEIYDTLTEVLNGKQEEVIDTSKV